MGGGDRMSGLRPSRATTPIGKDNWRCSRRRTSRRHGMASKISAAASESAFARAQKVLPGGVSSPVRAFKHVGGAPVFLSKGEGARITDLDGNGYTDYCLAWGPLIL